MIKESSFRILPILVLSFIIIILAGCKKDNGSDNPYNNRTTALFNPDVVYGTMTDLDGNSYKTIQIGTQTWMAENLRTTKYNDGTPIPIVAIDAEWVVLETDACCNYNNTNDPDSISTYGRLYNWKAVQTEKLAPEGWHIPSYKECTVLSAYLGDWVAGLKLKEIGTTHWNSSDTDVDNSSGFTAIPSGVRYVGGSYSGIGGHCRYWTSSGGVGTIDAIAIILKSSSNIVDRDDVNLFQGNFGFSVRCVKDN